MTRSSICVTRGGGLAVWGVLSVFVQTAMGAGHNKSPFTEEQQHEMELENLNYRLVPSCLFRSIFVYLSAD